MERTVLVALAPLAGYVCLLLILGRKKTTPTLRAFRDGNHQFRFWTIFIMVTALWSSSLIVVELDAAYRYGVSAMWYGVSVAVMSLLVASLMPQFQRYHYISNSDLLGRVFGPGVRRLSALVIGGTFPIFALSNALAAAIFLDTALHWPLWVSMTLISALLLVSVQFGGILSLARLQGFNLIMVMTGMLFAVWKIGGKTPPSSLPGLSPSYWHWWNTDHGLVVVWFGMNILNVVSAQAEIQTLAAARTKRDANWATWISTLWLGLIIALSTWLGMRTRELTHNSRLNGLQAFFHLVLAHTQAPIASIMGMAMWSLALMWCGPLLFSGAISVSGDLLGKPSSVSWLRFSLIIEAAVMILYALWRPDQLAWWRVFGLTLRNAAVVGPTLAALIWGRNLSSRAVVAAMGSGVSVAVGLNAMAGFSPTHFILGISPMWTAATTTIVCLSTFKLWSRKPFLAFAGAAVWVIVTWLLIVHHPSVNILGVLVLVSGLLFLFYAHVVTHRTEEVTPTLLSPSSAEPDP